MYLIRDKIRVGTKIRLISSYGLSIYRGKVFTISKCVARTDDYGWRGVCQDERRCIALGPLDAERWEIVE